MTDEIPSRSQSHNPNEAQIRVDPQTGHEFIYVERPEVVSSADMTEVDAQAFENARPTEEELRSNRWSEE